MKDSNNNGRRRFIKKNLALGFGLAVAKPLSSTFYIKGNSGAGSRLASLGGRPVFSVARPPKWPDWPLWIPQTDEKQVLNVLRSGVWSRSKVVDQFETTFAGLVGAKKCVTTVNGTNAMICALANLDIGWGDEVLVPPYTFIATVQAILQVGAIPVFVDTNRKTFQMDVDKLEGKITSRTRAILPVHIAGLPSDMLRIMEIARKHKLVVVEDACQAHMAEINHQKVGTFGDAGCFSFQNSKNLPIGEGGAIVSNDATLIDKCYSYHNYGIAHGSVVDQMGRGIVMLGTKLRLTEYQAAIGLAQLKRLEEQMKTREQNAEYLKSQLELIPGIVPYELCPNVTRGAFHLFPFRYQQKYFEGISKRTFLKALSAEGVPVSGGYATLNDQPYLKDAFQTKGFRQFYSEKQLDWDAFLERNHCPENDLLCKEEGAWFTQNLLLGTREDMDAIALAVQKVYKNAADLKKAEAS